jgi:serine protease Do
MPTRKTSVFYGLLIAVASMALGLVISSRLGLAPLSSAQTVAVPPMNSAPITGSLDAQTFRNIAKAVTPSVVSIRTESRRQAPDLSDFFGGGGTLDDFLRRFGGPGQQGQQPGQGGQGQRPREQTTVASGTGFIISKDGFILTNSHVVEDATKIEVSLFGDDEQKYAARLIGHDRLTDSALLQLVDKPARALAEVKFGDSAQMAPGDWVMAIGNPFGYTYSVTVGVISATERLFPVTDGRWNDMLQTDAAINPGNSGGPLLNVRGEVIGMNTAIITNGQSEGTNIGIGFAVPSNAVRELLPQLHEGKVVRGRIGVVIAQVPREGFEDFGLRTRAGAIVQQVVPGGAAARAGIEPGDVIVEFNGRPVAKTDDLQKSVMATRPGASVPIKVLRNKQETTLSVTVDELDLDAEQAQRAQGGGGAEPPEVQPETGFGLTLQDIPPNIARRLQLPAGQTGVFVTGVDPQSGSAEAGIRGGDVILRINNTPVSSAAEAGRLLQRVASGRLAQLLIWRDGNQLFVPVRKD